MSRIIKSVCMRSTPVIIEHVMPEPPPCDPAEDIEFDEPEGIAEAEILETEDEVEAIPAEVTIEIQNMIAAAQQEAAAIIDEATQKAEEALQTAKESGYQQGYEAGMAQGEQAGLEKTTQTIAEAASEAQKMLDEAERQSLAMQLAAEEQILDLAMTIARKIVAREVGENPMAILPIVQNALSRVRDQEKITLRVNPEDYHLVLQARPELQTVLERDNSLSLIADPDLKPGDSIIETPYGILDARLDTQLELLKSALKDALR